MGTLTHHIKHPHNCVESHLSTNIKLIVPILAVDLLVAAPALATSGAAVIHNPPTRTIPNSLSNTILLSSSIIED